MSHDFKDLECSCQPAWPSSTETLRCLGVTRQRTALTVSKPLRQEGKQGQSLPLVRVVRLTLRALVEMLAIGF